MNTTLFNKGRAIGGNDNPSDVQSPAEPIEGNLLTNAAKLGLSEPMDRLLDYRNRKFSTSLPRFWAIVDYNQHSSKKRFHLFDRENQSVNSFLVAHGKKSETEDNGLAVRFSNVEGSNMSSLGICRGGELYEGKHGLSMMLDGLEPTNSNLRERSVVCHESDYVNEDYVKHFGRVGRSEGCLAVSEQDISTIIQSLKNGSFMMLWHDQLKG